MARKKSGFRDKYRKQKEDLQKRHQDAVNNRDTGMYGSFFDRPKLLNDVGFWKCSEGTHIIDIVPFIAGNNMPISQDTAEGEPIWFLDLWIHRNVGVLGHPYPCLANNWGERCPICEHLRDNRDQYSEDEWKAAKAKRRSIYFVWNHTNPTDEEKGIFIWDVAHWFMEDKLSMISVKPKGGGTIAYYDIDNGKNVQFTRRGTGAMNTQYGGHAFYDRDEPEIPDHILDQTFTLDEAVIHPSYDELLKIFNPDSTSEKKERTPVKDESVEESSSTKEDEDESPVLGDEECPGGGSFGADIENLKACRNCPNWDACEEEADRLDAMDKSEPEPEPEPESEPPKKRLRKAKEKTDAPAQTKRRRR